MCQNFYILVLCLFLLGGCLASKRREIVGTEWEKTNSMSLEHGERHEPGFRITDPDIFIDGDEDAIPIEEGSVSAGDDDTVTGSGHGAGDDDEDSEMGSADFEHKEECIDIKNELIQAHLVGSHIPDCDENGNFKPLQCHSSTGYCWCVDVHGREIEKTRQQARHIPDCPSHRGRSHDVNNQRIPGFYDVTTQPSDIDDIEMAIDEEDESEVAIDNTGVENTQQKMGGKKDEPQEGESVAAIMKHPGILAGIIGGAVVGLLCAVLLVMFIVYRMRKKDEGSYALDEPTKRAPPMNSYSQAPQREFYA